MAEEPAQEEAAAIADDETLEEAADPAEVPVPGIEEARQEGTEELVAASSFPVKSRKTR